MKKSILSAVCLVLLLAGGFAQDGGEVPDDIDSLFDSPEAGVEEPDGGEEAPSPGDTGTQADDIDSLFEGGEQEEPSAAPESEASLEEAFLQSEGVDWGGEFTGEIEARLRYRDLLPEGDEWDDYEDSVSFTLSSRLNFDARPERNFRVAGKLSLGFPFFRSIVTDPLTGASVRVPELAIRELFSDFNWEERLFFRFGKQTAAWGLSRFYQVADPISTEVKDPQEADTPLEGPLALKVSFPVGLHTLFGYVVAKDTYLPDNPGETGLDNLGYGLKGDFFLPAPDSPVFSDAELSAGFYYQKDIAPRAVFGLSTSVGPIELFSDQVITRGTDAYRLTDGEIIPGIYGTEKDDSTLFYSATLGFLYRNPDWNLTLYGEYFFNGQGSTDPEYLGKLLDRFNYELALPPSEVRTISAGDLFAYQSAHNSAVSLSFSEIAGSDDWSTGVFWQQNWVDSSGFVVPSLTFSPWKFFSVTAGARIAWGDEKTEFVSKLGSVGVSGEGFTAEPRRLTGYIGVSLGSGKF